MLVFIKSKWSELLFLLRQMCKQMFNAIAFIVLVLLVAALVLVCIRIFVDSVVMPMTVSQSVIPLPAERRTDRDAERKTGERVAAVVAAPFTSHGEAECGRILNRLFPRYSFQVRARPRWLMNDFPGRRTPPRPLELDYFCEELKLAVEYNGKQHRELVPRFHGTDEHAHSRFCAQLLRDATKKRKCREHGIDLIVVWYDVAISDIERFLTEHPLIVNRISAV
jgi:hypothetical protein